MSGNIFYLILTVLAFGLAATLKNTVGLSDKSGLILAAIGLYFFVVFLYKLIKDDRADSKEANEYKKRMKEREKRKQKYRR